MAAAQCSGHYRPMQDTPTLPHQDHLWDLVLRRQPDAGFLYAVTTMGVFCRPACPSPRPLRKNTRFFPSVDDAEAAGFRACKRCDPKGERARREQDVVRDSRAHIESANAMPSLDALARRAGLSSGRFLRMFREHTGVTPRSYAEGVRARRLQAALAPSARVRMPKLKRATDRKAASAPDRTLHWACP